MKKYLSYFTLAILAVSSLAFASCSDDDEVDYATAIIGRWEVSTIYMSPDYEYDTGLKEGYVFMFGHDGWYAFFEDAGSWSLNGDKLTLISNDPDSIPRIFKIKNLNETFLEIIFSPESGGTFEIKLKRL